MAVIPTVKIEAKNALGFARINEDQFDEKKHKRWKAKSSPAGSGGLEEKPGFKLEDVVQDPALTNLREAGFGSALKVVEATKAELKGVEGVGDRIVDKLVAHAATFVREV